MKKLLSITALAALALAMILPQAAPADIDRSGESAVEYLYITAYNSGLHITRAGSVTREAAESVYAGELDIVKLPDLMRMTPDGDWEQLPIF